MIKELIIKDVMILVINMKRVTNMMIIDTKEEIKERDKAKIIDISINLITNLKDVRINTVQMTITNTNLCKIHMSIKEIFVRLNKYKFNPNIINAKIY